MSKTKPYKEAMLEASLKEWVEFIKEVANKAEFLKNSKNSKTILAKETRKAV